MFYLLPLILYVEPQSIYFLFQFLGSNTIKSIEQCTRCSKRKFAYKCLNTTCHVWTLCEKCLIDDIYENGLCPGCSKKPSLVKTDHMISLSDSEEGDAHFVFENVEVISNEPMETSHTEIIEVDEVEIISSNLNMTFNEPMICNICDKSSITNVKVIIYCNF